MKDSDSDGDREGKRADSDSTALGDADRRVMGQDRREREAARHERRAQHAGQNAAAELHEEVQRVFFQPSDEQASGALQQIQRARGAVPRAAPSDATAIERE